MDLSNLLSGIKPQESTKNEKTALPAGTYDVRIEKVEGKKNETTGAAGISMQMRVFGSKFNNYCLFDYMLISGNENALEYSLPKLKKLGELCKSEMTESWLGKSVRVNLSVNKKDVTKNIIWGYSEYVADDNTPINTSSNSVAFSVDDLPF